MLRYLSVTFWYSSFFIISKYTKFDWLVLCVSENFGCRVQICCIFHICIAVDFSCLPFGGRCRVLWDCVALAFLGVPWDEMENWTLRFSCQLLPFYREIVFLFYLCY